MTEKKTNEETKQQVEKMLKVKFLNIEDGEEDITFSYGKRGKVKLYRLHPGYTYELPEDVVNHLNNVTKPVYKLEEDQYGNTKHVQAGETNRFSCVPVK